MTTLGLRVVVSAKRVLSGATYLFRSRKAALALSERLTINPGVFVYDCESGLYYAARGKETATGVQKYGTRRQLLRVIAPATMGDALCDCGRPVERVRMCFAIPTCFACLPPPPPIDTLHAAFFKTLTPPPLGTT